MIIKNNTIKMAAGDINMGMPFAKVEDVLKKEIYAQKAPDEKGLGHIIIKSIEFYGLKGTCTLYFKDGKLRQIGLSPEWNLYDLVDGNGNRLPIDIAVEKIARLSEDGLKDALGTPVEKSEYRNLVFVQGNITVFTSIARSGDKYSVIIR